MELLHVAQAGGPLHQRAHGRAIALDLGFNVDDVARVEAEGLYGVDAVGRVVECDCGRAQADGRWLKVARRRS